MNNLVLIYGYLIRAYLPTFIVAGAIGFIYFYYISKNHNLCLSLLNYFV